MSDPTDVATEMALWQGTALKLPLPQLRDLASGSMTSLADSLNAFNTVYLNHTRDKESDDALAAALTEVVKRATAAAIFTLGVNQRTGRASALN